MYRTIDRAAGLLIAGLFLASFTPPAHAQSAPVIIDLSQPDQPMTLKLGMLSANIVVIGERRNDIQLEVDGGNSGRRIITPSGSQQIGGASYRLSATEENNIVEVSSDWRMSTLDITARVPASAAVNLWTTNDGTIVVENVQGEMQLRNTNGPITVKGAASAVIAESVNEDINISFADLDGVTASSLSSVNGDLAVGLPGQPKAQVHIDTARGQISSDFEIEVQPSEPKVSRSEDSGTIEIAVENMIIANINGGGPVIRMKTLNGNIQINDADMTR
ncbi:MAG: hypothetical protein AAFQ62_04675 [Pseudomonadota bacterium]